jgi:hypothetical protein
MDTTNSLQPAVTSRVAIRLPPFWADSLPYGSHKPRQFFLAGISSEKSKFLHVVSQLDHQYAAEVEGIIISPPE